MVIDNLTVSALNAGWSVTAARQVKRIREEYIKAIMRQVYEKYIKL
jgi:hypothetical protein